MAEIQEIQKVQSKHENQSPQDYRHNQKFGVADYYSDNGGMGIEGKRFQEILYGLTDTVIVSALDGRILFVNRRGLDGTINGGIDSNWLNWLDQGTFEIAKKAMSVCHFQKSTLSLDLSIKVPGQKLALHCVKFSSLSTDGQNEVLVQFSNILDEQASRDFQDMEGASTVLSNKLLRFQNSVEQELHKYQELLRCILDCTPASIFAFDIQHRFMLVNEAMSQFYGKSQEEVIGKTLHDVFPSDIADRLLKINKSVMQTGKSVSIEEEVKSIGSSSLRTVVTTKAPLRDFDGKITGLVGVATDVTDQRKFEEDLRGRERRLRAIFETELDCIKILDPTGKLLELNPAGLLVLEASSKEEVCAYGLLNFILPEHRSKFLDFHRRVVNGERISCEFEIIGMRGTRRWIESHATPLQERAGGVVNVLAVSRDITARKNSELFLKLQLDFARNLISSLQDGFVMVDMSGAIVEVNPAMCSMFGFTRDELVGRRPPFPYWPQVNIDAIQAVFDQTKVGKTGHFEFIYRCKDGTQIPVLVTPSEIKDSSGNIVNMVATIKDITSRIEKEKLLDEHRVKLTHASRMSALGQMSAGIAHEINNPLAIILGTVSQLNLVEKDPVKFSEKVHVIQKSCTRIAKIVSGLLKFSRNSEKSAHKICDLSHLIKEAMTLTIAQAKKNGVAMTCELEDGVFICCDEVEIEQVAINLIHNAICAASSLDDKWVKIVVKSDKEFVALQVVDSGKGISAPVLARIFDPFFTTKPVGEGTGLGLSISKGILDDHGASISVLPNSSNTCFEVRFPKVRTRSE